MPWRSYPLSPLLSRVSIPSLLIGRLTRLGNRRLALSCFICQSSTIQGLPRFAGSQPPSFIPATIWEEDVEIGDARNFTITASFRIANSSASPFLSSRELGNGIESVAPVVSSIQRCTVSRFKRLSCVRVPEWGVLGISRRENYLVYWSLIL